MTLVELFEHHPLPWSMRDSKPGVRNAAIIDSKGQEVVSRHDQEVLEAIFRLMDERVRLPKAA